MRILYLAAILFVLTATPAAALPLPMSPAELLAASDLVALVRVLSVTCVGVIEHVSERLRIYTAELGVLRVRKGDARRYDVVSVRWEETPSGLPGPWFVAYRPGGKGWTHLVRRGVAYETTWWNATEDWRRRGSDLSQQVMETRHASLVARLPFIAVRATRDSPRA